MYNVSGIKIFFAQKRLVFENGRMHVHVVPNLGFPFIINTGMLSKNSDSLWRLLLQDGSIASKSVQGGC